MQIAYGYPCVSAVVFYASPVINKYLYQEPFEEAHRTTESSLRDSKGSAFFFPLFLTLVEYPPPSGSLYRS